MRYIHVRNLEKYHPKYKDRELKWAKIYINMADGDPETEMIADEIDWARFVKIILLELRAQKPLPDVNSYWERKGFNLKKRSMSITLQMLQSFLEVLTDNYEEPLQNRNVDKIRLDNINNINIVHSSSPSTPPIANFDVFWSNYPRKEDKKNAFKTWCRIKPDEKLLETMLTAITRQRNSEQWKTPKFIPLPSTWLNGSRWEDGLLVPQDPNKTERVRKFEEGILGKHGN